MANAIYIYSLPMWPQTFLTIHWLLIIRTKMRQHFEMEHTKYTLWKGIHVIRYVPATTRNTHLDKNNVFYRGKYKTLSFSEESKPSLVARYNLPTSEIFFGISTYDFELF